MDFRINNNNKIQLKKIEIKQKRLKIMLLNMSRIRII